MSMLTNPDEMSSQLAERKRNLQIINECIDADSHSSEKLLEVREFLQSRIKTIEAQLASLSN
jgi:septal ring factor EnvC (AmiA/AmiB activator)